MSVDRRQFLQTAAGCQLGLLLSACATVPALQATAAAGRLRIQQDKLHAAFGDSDAVLVQGEGLPEGIYLVRDKSGAIMQAVGATCTHLGCQVRPAQTFFRCPCHGSTFTLDGDVVRGPATRPLARYEAHLADDHLVIELP